MNIKLTIVDDHPVVVKGLLSIIEDYEQFQVLDTCNTASSLLEALKLHIPDVLLLDVQLPDKPGDELAATVSQKYPQVAILALTNLDQVFNVKNMFLNGVTGYMLKTSGPDVMVEAIETVCQKKQFIDPVMKEQMLAEMVDARSTANPVPALTQREQEILKLIAAEYTSHEIAARLFLSHRTIESHRLNLLLKLGVRNTAGLVRKAIQLNILK